MIYIHCCSANNRTLFYYCSTNTRSLCLLIFSKKKTIYGVDWANMFYFFKLNYSPPSDSGIVVKYCIMIYILQVALV